jgi:hypothetical protein
MVSKGIEAEVLACLGAVAFQESKEMLNCTGAETADGAVVRTKARIQGAPNAQVLRKYSE